MRITYICAFLLLIVSSNCFAVTDSNSLKDEILSLILEGDIDLAKIKTQELLANYSHEDNLSKFLVILAQRYNWLGYLQQADDNYQYVIDNAADSNTVEQAKFGAKVVDILLKINQGTDSGAVAHINELTASFSHVSELPEYAFRITKQYESSGNYQQAQFGYMQVSQSFADSDYAEIALLNGCRLSIWLDISSDKTGEASDKLLSFIRDHRSSTYFPGVLYYLGQQCRWQGKYDFAEIVLSAVIGLDPDDSLKSDAQLSYYGARALKNIQRGNFADAQDDINIILSSYEGNKDFAEVCFALADKLRWRGKAAEMKVLCNAIVQNCPDSDQASLISDQMEFFNILALIDAGDISAAETAITALYSKEMVSEELNKMKFFIAEQFYFEGLQRRDQGDHETANIYYTKAVEKWEELVSSSPAFTLGPRTRIWPADCYFSLKTYEKSLENYKSDVESYQDHPMRWYGLFMIGRNYALMAKQGSISSELADSAIKAAYEEILSSYPNCPAIGAVNKELNK